MYNKVKHKDFPQNLANVSNYPKIFAIAKTLFSHFCFVPAKVQEACLLLPPPPHCLRPFPLTTDSLSPRWQKEGQLGRLVAPSVTVEHYTYSISIWREMSCGFYVQPLSPIEYIIYLWQILWGRGG